jgi:CDP-4-dehydro-6-deoxyglucose reductase
LIKLRPGDRFRAFATYGDFTYEPKVGRAACFIATGTGIAPFRSMVFSKAFQENAPTQAFCLLGVREEEEVIYTDEFRGVPGLTWVAAVSRPSDNGTWTGFKGRVTDWLRAQGESFPWKETEFYLCGNGAMIDETKALLAERGVEKSSIHQEIYYKTPKDASAAKTAEAAPQH